MRVDKRKLRGIKPFNGYWFRSCYYHQLIAAYGYFGVQSEVILNNLYYEFEYGDAGLAVRERDALDQAGLEVVTGIKRRRERMVENLWEYVVAAVRAKRPVLVAQDNFYIPYRWDFMEKKHRSHFLLVYGFDRESRTLCACEHNFVNSFDFREKILPFDCVQRAYDGFCENLLSPDGFTTEVFSRGKQRPLPERICMAESLVGTLRSPDFSPVKQFLGSLDTPDLGSWTPGLGRAVEGLSDLYNATKVLRERYAAGFALPELDQALDELWAGLIYLRNILHRLNIARRGPADCQSVRARLRSIPALLDRVSELADRQLEKLLQSRRPARPQTASEPY